MRIEQRKIVIIGCGMVGMSYAYCLLNQNICDELVLIDSNQTKAQGEAMDLNHGVAFASANMKIRAGAFADCADADIVAIAAGVAQKEGETRLDLLARNVAVFRAIVDPVVESGFNGIFLVATNPVDIMAKVVQVLSGFNPRQVVGTGTTLDTARLRYLLGDYFHVDPKNVHAYVLGEHGDSEFVAWQQANIATLPLRELCEQSSGRYCYAEMQTISDEVRGAAQQIIQAKNATYYGIGMALARISKAILSDENSVLTVSAMMHGQYGERGVYIGCPCIVNRKGVRKVIEIDLSTQEREQFAQSCAILRDCLQEIQL